MIAYHRLTGTVRLKNVLNAADERAKVRRETKTGEEEGGGRVGGGCGVYGVLVQRAAR